MWQRRDCIITQHARLMVLAVLVIQVNACVGALCHAPCA
jgi:hypothetical protein